MSGIKQSRRATDTTVSSTSKWRSSVEVAGKPAALNLPKKRHPLGDITNNQQRRVAKSVLLKGLRTSSLPPSSSVQCSITQPKEKRGTGIKSVSSNILHGNRLNIAYGANLSSPTKRTTEGFSSLSTIQDVNVVSSNNADELSVSVDESISTCDSFKTPEVEFKENEIPEVNSFKEKNDIRTYNKNEENASDYLCSQNQCADMEIDDEVVNVDSSNFESPQICSSMSCDIYKHLRSSESKKRPSINFMETVQKDVNASMRAILIDWLVEVAEEYRLVPDTLYLTVNYIDRYLSGNVMNKQKLQLLGVACMMIASKYEEICAPHAEEFCYITDNTYFKDEILEMESSVLNYLKFELTAPTAKCFLRRFIRVAQSFNEVPSMQFECLANYITELSLLEYSMLCYAPSLIAASAVFLAKFVLLPLKRPWNHTMQHYTQYKPSDLYYCVKNLHRLCCGNENSTLPAIREKYYQHKYKFVAKKYFPPSIPIEFFQD